MPNIDDKTEIERSYLPEQVSRVISDGLLSGRFKPGDALVETELSELLGVSRSPIREALVELQKAGLVTKEPGRRAIIRRWSNRDLEELFAVRALLEGFAARLVAAQGKAVNLSGLDDAVAAMRVAASKEDYGRLVQLDLEFHEELWRLSGNNLLRNVLEGLKQQFRLFLTMNWKFHGGADEVHKNHLVVMDALRRAEPDEAERIMHDHVVVERMVATKNS